MPAGRPAKLRSDIIRRSIVLFQDTEERLDELRQQMAGEDGTLPSRSAVIRAAVNAVHDMTRANPISVAGLKAYNRNAH